MNPPNPFRHAPVIRLAPIDEGLIPDCGCPEASAVRDKIAELGAFEIMAWLMAALTSCVFLVSLTGVYAGRESVLVATMIAIGARDLILLGVILRHRLRRLGESNRELLRQHDPVLARRESGLRAEVAAWNAAADFLNGPAANGPPELIRAMENARATLVRDIDALKSRANSNP